MLLAEAIAIREACIYCIKSGFSDVCIESDNASIVSWCSALSGAPPWEIVAVVKYIISHAQLASLSIVVVYKSANQVANWIAWYARNSSSWCFCLVCLACFSVKKKEE